MQDWERPGNVSPRWGLRICYVYPDLPVWANSFRASGAGVWQLVGETVWKPSRLGNYLLTVDRF